MPSTLLMSPATRPGKKNHLLRAAAVGAAALTLTLTGCAASGAAGAAGSATTAGGGEGIKIAIMGGAPDDPFWSTVKRGAEAAAGFVTAAGGTVEFISMPNYDNFNSDAAKLVGNMDALDPSAVIVPNWAPEAQNDAIKTITAKGIPVIIYNAGGDTVDDVGARMYIGTDEYESGVASGEEFAELGAEHIVCVNSLPGTVNIEARCQGVVDGAADSGSTATVLNLPSTQFGDPSAITQAIKGALLQDDSIDAIITISTTDSDSAAAGIEQSGAGDRVLLATFGVSASGLERTKAGTQAFSVDQQPFAQGYYAVSTAFQLAAYGIALPDDLLTGPSLITPENVDLVVSGTELGVR